MYKNIEVLSKENYGKKTYKSVSAAEAGRHLGLIPIGFTEVIDMCSIAPVVILGEGENSEFVSLCGLSSEISIFNKQKFITPLYTKSYPFLNLNIIKEDKKQKLIGIDTDKDCVGDKFENKIFDKKGELTSDAQTKIDMVKELNRQREIGNKIIEEFKKHKVLVENSFKIKTGDKEKVLLEKFMMVDRKKVYELESKVLIEWAQKGWLTLIDCHLRSLNNFPLIATI